MLKQTATPFQSFPFGENAIAASRQVWLASLGAAAITRDWVQAEATQTFRSLVKEGTVVESRAVTFVGDQIEVSMSRANTMWKKTRRTVESTVKQAADTAVALAQQALPISLPKIALPVAANAAKTRKTPARAAKAAKSARGTAKVAGKAKRVVKTATRR